MSDILNTLWNKKRLDMRSLKDLELSHLCQKILDQKNARQIVWHLINNQTDIPVCYNTHCNNKVLWLNDHYQKFCGRKCSAINSDTRKAFKKTNIKKYGTDNPSKNSEIKNKIDQTMIDRYGVKRPMQDQAFLIKASNTYMSKHGVSHQFYDPDVQEKIKESFRKKYGADNPQQNTDVRNKTEKTNLERYGNKNSFVAPEIQKKIRQTNLDRYGYEKGLLSSKIQEKIKETIKNNYGVEFHNQKHFSQYAKTILFSSEIFSNFMVDKTIGEASRLLKVDSSTIRNYIEKYNVQHFVLNESSLETEMTKFLDELNINYIRNDRKTIQPQELDFYLPNHNVAIEMNGIYWHSEKFLCDKMYHYNKWHQCDQQGIHLISIFEDLWVNNNHKVKNALRSILGQRKSGTGARNLQIAPVTAMLARPFADQYHLQGFVSGTHYGAFTKQMKMVGLMTFGLSRNQHFELKRFVTDSCNYPGLASKLFKYAQADLQFEEVISFSDNTWFTGKMYEKLNFKYIETIKPSYRYFYQGRLVHCSTFTKRGIVNKFPHMKEHIDHGMTEREAMMFLDIPRVWDCGKRKWIWSKKQD